MSIEIDQAIIEETTKCTKCHGCLSGTVRPLCKISNTVGSKVVFTCSEEPNGCTYQSSFGYSFMCSCPVRKEIYRIYKA